MTGSRKTGACYEVVRYEDHYDADGNRLDNTSIQDIYAVVKSTGEVIPSGRTGWADVGNEEYRRPPGNEVKKNRDVRMPGKRQFFVA